MKLSEYVFKHMPVELVDFKDEVTTIINFGKYAFMVLYNSPSGPTWKAREGENVFWVYGTGRRLYCWINSGWVYIGWGSSGAIDAGDYWRIHDTDGDTEVTTELTADDDYIRFYTAGTDCFEIDSAQNLTMLGDKKFVFDGTGNNYSIYNSATEYLQFWTAGDKRMEM